MKRQTISIISLVLAFITLLCTVSCACSEGPTDDPQDTTAQTLPQGVIGPAPNTQTGNSSDSHDSNAEPSDKPNNDIQNPIDEPLKHLIFGADSYTQGDNMIAKLGRGQLPTDFKSPMTMYIKTYAEWQEFYGGLPRSLVDSAFTSAIANIKASFFDTSALLLVILDENSPHYKHSITLGELRNGSVGVDIITTKPEGAIQEDAYDCIIIPIEKKVVGADVVVRQTYA